MESIIENVATFIDKIRYERRCKEVEIGRVEEISEHMKSEFSVWTQMMTHLLSRKNMMITNQLLKKFWN